MDQVSLVESRILDGWNLVLEIARKGFPVAVAAWVKQSEKRRPILYLAFPEIDSNQYDIVHKAYFDARAKLDKVISSSDVTLIGVNNRLAASLLAAIRFTSSWRPTSYDEPYLDGIEVDEVYIYPPVHHPAIPDSTPMSIDEVRRTILDQLDRTGLLEPSTVVLRDGSRLLGVPCGVEVNNSAMTVKLLDDTTHIQRIVPLSEIVWIG